MESPKTLQQTCFQALMCADPGEKVDLVSRLDAKLPVHDPESVEFSPVIRVPIPGRPDKPELVHPTKVPRRRLGSAAGRASLVHAIAHIEFNAINLALDAVYRFADMPTDYYQDWVSVAKDEARHFQMLLGRLQDMGHQYGDFPAHNGLWEMALKTDHSCLVRMALVPRVLEARGLDVTPGMIERLRGTGDNETVAALETILEEEVRHVEIGTTWFRWCCGQQDKQPDSTFSDLMREHFGNHIRGPFNYPARLAAGFNQVEMSLLEGMSKG